jgi:anti-sigma factor RsiW
LISKACDGECTPEELELMKEHLKGCPGCRKTLVEYREISMLMSARLTAVSCPPAPAVSSHAPFALRFLSVPKAKVYALRAVTAAACVAFFFAGSLFGSSNARKEIAGNISPVAVATPSMWVAEKPDVTALSESLEAEQPFTDSINQYRLAVSEELRKSDVDWLRVRELVEAIGELRTDLELLTIHMAYLEIRTGNSPYEVAEHWENLGGKAAYR